MTGLNTSKYAWIINPGDLVEIKSWISKRLGCSTVLGGIQTVRCGWSFYKCVQASFLSTALGTNDRAFQQCGSACASWASHQTVKTDLV